MMLGTSRLSCAWGVEGSGLMPNAASLMQFEEQTGEQTGFWIDPVCWRLLLRRSHMLCLQRLQQTSLC